MLKGIESGCEERLLLRPGIARLKGLETLRVVRQSRLELKEVMTLRRDFLGEDIEGVVNWKVSGLMHVVRRRACLLHSTPPGQRGSQH